MELCANEKQQLLERFPDFELSYENVSHKKVSSDYHLGIAISTGKKYFAWFTFSGNKDVCYLMELNKDKKIIKIMEVETLYHSSLSLGTIFYGTIIETDTPTISAQYQVFSVEDVYYYKGISLKQMCFGQKMGFLKECFDKYLVCSFNDVPMKPPSKQVVFTLPCMWMTSSFYDKTMTEIETATQSIPEHLIKKLGYTPHHIQLRKLSSISPYVNITLSNKPSTQPQPPPQLNPSIQPCDIQTKITRNIPDKLYYMDFNKPQYRIKSVFQVCADLQYDIYHLYAFGKNKASVYYNVAYIPNYKTSVFMNSIFRKIRENQNLDWIEESDDEEDFEDLREDKYVDLKKMINMECVFHPKFKKWVPLREVGVYEKIVHITKLVNGYM